MWRCFSHAFDKYLWFWNPWAKTKLIFCVKWNIGPSWWRAIGGCCVIWMRKQQCDCMDQVHLAEIEYEPCLWTWHWHWWNHLNKAHLYPFSPLCIPQYFPLVPSYIICSSFRSFHELLKFSFIILISSFVGFGICGIQCQISFGSFLIDM